MARELPSPEANAVWARMAQAWDLDHGYWYPLQDTTRLDVLALEAGPFLKGDGRSVVQGILRRHGVRECWEFSEDAASPALEVQLEEWDIEYVGLELYWSSEPLDWLVYASHEASITLGGAWLIEEFKQAWPEWRRHLWDCGDPSFVHRSV